jgi:hypothetical protein
VALAVLIALVVATVASQSESEKRPRNKCKGTCLSTKQRVLIKKCKGNISRGASSGCGDARVCCGKKLKQKKNQNAVVNKCSGKCISSKNKAKVKACKAKENFTVKARGCPKNKVCCAQKKRKGLNLTKCPGECIGVRTLRPIVCAGEIIQTRACPTDTVCCSQKNSTVRPSPPVILRKCLGRCVSAPSLSDVVPLCVGQLRQIGCPTNFACCYENTLSNETDGGANDVLPVISNDEADDQLADSKTLSYVDSEMAHDQAGEIKPEEMTKTPLFIGLVSAAAIVVLAAIAVVVVIVIKARRSGPATSPDDYIRA